MEEEYQCETCDKRTISYGGIPMCCGKPMKKLLLDVCTEPEDAEHARPMEDEDACDDGRAGLKINNEGGEKLNMEDDSHVCLVCGEEHGLDDIHHIEIKGETKKICKGCAAAIKGFV